jgi:membrane associated rhomboid family serine protease
MQNTPIRNKREPFFNNVPPGLLILGGVIGGIELFLQIFGLEWRSAAFLFLAFFPLDFGAPYKELFFAQNFVMFFSYSFLHGNFFHMIINVAIFFALGKQIEEQLGAVNLILIFISTSIAGAAAYQILSSGSSVPMVGASGGVFGFFGFIKGKELIYRIRHNLTILPFLNLIFGLIILHIILVLLYPTIIPFQIGWQGHLGGFASGLILASMIRK